ncbi:Tyrosine--tRNA ligase [Drechslerella dactyloides]|uniref:tyrosine--tRNA ligase n=1 Tax=Drechslerella dactyloides TaxID=74499 RepID=A0AAD6NHC6_DREDA|nr:Tyrosine--tRNA ligase [Drechslerella dactyloides]
MSNNAIPHPNLDLDTRLDLITRGLGRVDDADRQLIKATLQNKQNPSLFWGVAPTGRPHIGYLVPFVKIAELVEAGVEVKVLLADVYAFLVNYKHPRSLVAHRAEYYRFALSAVFEAILGLPVSRIQFHQETAFADTPEFINDTYELLSLTSLAAARSPNDELRNTMMISPLMCPVVQSLDERYMNCDIQLGGLDQVCFSNPGSLLANADSRSSDEKVGYYVYGDEFLPRIGHTKRHAHIYNTMLPGLTGIKMSATNPRSKIDLLDPPELVHQKITEAICDPGMNTEENPILALLKVVLLPISKLRLMSSIGGNTSTSAYAPFIKVGVPDGSLFSVASETGQPRHYASYEAIERDFLDRGLSSSALKDAVAKAMVQLLAPIRASFEANPRWRAVLKLAYPESEKDALASATTDASERFCIPAALREISNERVKLIPFNSTIHAGEFMRIAGQYPEIWTHGPIGSFDSAHSFVSDFIETFVRPRTDMVLYTVIDKTQPTNGVDKEGALVGLIAYISTSPVNLCTEIAFVITLPPFQRTHVTSNSVGLLLNFALNSPDEGGLGFRRVQWMTSSVNHKSIRTAEGMGFTKEGIGKAAHMNEDDLGRDSVMFSMCWDDWFLEGKKEHVNERMGR